MLFAFWLMPLKSKCSTARYLFQVFFRKQFSEATSPHKEEVQGELQIGTFYLETAFSPQIDFEKHFGSFCITSNRKCCTVVNLRSCHRLDLEFCSRWSHQICFLCVSEHAWRQAGEVRLCAFFFLLLSSFQRFLFPPVDKSPLQACLTALCLQISHPCSLWKAIPQFS